MTVKPIFVSGIGRSGTSALLASLASHKSMHQYPRVGEAPFVTSFLNFLVDYEDKSPGAEYNKKNYRLEDAERKAAIADFLILNQCGQALSNETEEKYWVAKTSLLEGSFNKAVEIFDEVRCVYIMRNGIEVINSARKFDGFKALGFDEHCRRWLDNIRFCRYLHDREFCSVIKHDQLVKFPEDTYKKVYKDLGIAYDEAPANWISSNIFNSSFDSTAKGVSTSSVFDNRVVDAWSEWSEEEKSQFIEKCDPIMREFGFVRPYDEASMNSIKSDLTSDSSATSTELEKIEVVFADTAATEHAEQVATGRFSEIVVDACKDRMLPSELNYIVNVSAKHNYVFVNNPKVASTSLLKRFQNIENAKKAGEMANPHQRNKSPLRTLGGMTHAEQESWFKSGDAFRFAFARDPFSRILSAYLSKIDNPLRVFKYDSTKPTSVPPKGQIMSLITGKSIDESSDFSMAIDFPTFVEAICSLDPYVMDLHWKPQVDLLMTDKISYDYIGKFENLANEMAHISEHVGIEDTTALEYSANRTESKSKLNSYYTPELQKLVVKKYSADFEQFDYPVSIAPREVIAA